MSTIDETKQDLLGAIRINFATEGIILSTQMEILITQAFDTMADAVIEEFFNRSKTDGLYYTYHRLKSKPITKEKLDTGGEE